jgi:hypothetical protein
MTLLLRLFAALLAFPLTACVSFDLPHEAIERSATRSFTVDPHSTVRVAVNGGSVHTVTGDAGTVQITLIERVRTASEAQIDQLLADYQVTIGKQGDEVEVTARRRADSTWRLFKPGQVSFSAKLVVPADVQLDLGTSGGAITVDGDRTASVKANTSGGSIKVGGGSGPIEVHTSGGAITVDRALASLKANTSGGSIRVAYVGPQANTVEVSTSGGGIDVGVDPSARLDVSAGTSGGGVRVSGLPFESEEHGRSRVRGAINGGGGRLHASTSGGGIAIYAARP